MKSFAVRVFAAVLLSIALGFLSARWAIEKVAETQAVHAGPWFTNPAIGGADADPYTKAFIALHGLLALNRSEAIYFFANEDSSGTPLSGRCTYLIKGDPINARWWTITAYGSDDYLIANGEDRYSVSVLDVGPDPYSFVVAKQAPNSGVYLLNGGVEHFALTLRAYNPSAALLNDLANAELPAIIRGACDE